MNLPNDTATLSFSVRCEALPWALGKRAGGIQVPPDTPYILLKVDWTKKKAAAPKLRLTTPGGMVIEEAGFAAFGVAPMPELSGPGSAAYHVDASNAQSLLPGTWYVDCLDAASLGTWKFVALRPVEPVQAKLRHDRTRITNIEA